MGESSVPQSEAATRVSEQRLTSRFCLIKSLGVGGMGEVYLAEDSKLHRRVAIKTIRPDLCKEPEIRKRIERECLLHAKVGAHPHIVTLYDKLEEGDQINLVMEFVEGETLQDLLERHGKEGTVPPLRDAVDIAAQCLEALSRIHAHGIVHRDIKPSNIILTREDGGNVCAKLMDFGIARMQVDDEFTSRLTQQFGSSPGTPLYMAPEQIDPQTFGEISPATDVYAMGIMLYQLTSGEPPFGGTITQIFNGHLRGVPPPLHAKAKGRVPEVLEEVVQCALAKSPGERFPTAKAFREELLRASLDGDAAATTAGRAPHTTASAVAPPSLPSTGTSGNRTMLSSQADLASAASGQTMLSGARARSGEVRQKRKTMQLVVAVLLLVVLAAAAAGAYIVFGKGKTEPAKPTASPDQAASPATSDSPPAQPPATNPSAVGTPPTTATTPPPVTPTPPPVAPLVPAPDASAQPPAVTAPAAQVTSAPVPTAPTPQTSSGSAEAELMKGLSQRQAEPAPATPPPAPAAVTPAPAAPQAAAPKPAADPKTTKPVVKPKPTTIPKTEFKQTTTPTPAPSTPPPPAKSSGDDWGVKSETSYKK